jgi:hypothetical protein
MTPIEGMVVIGLVALMCVTGWAFIRGLRDLWQ